MLLAEQLPHLIALGTSSLILLWCLTLIIVASARGRCVFKCPRCHSKRIHSSLPRFGDNILRITEIKTFTCEACKKRFYALSRKRVVSSVH